MAAGTMSEAVGRTGTAEPQRAAIEGLPPGPRLPVAAQTWLLWDQEPRWIPALRRRYGDTFTIRAAPMGTCVYLADTADIKTVFTGDPKVFHAGEGNQVLQAVMGPKSVLIVDEDEHLATRKRLLPPFHGEAVRRYGEVIEEIATDSVARWPRDGEFALHPLMQEITLEVILRAVFGVTDAAKLAQMRPLVRRVADVAGPVMLMWVYPWLGKVGPWRRYREVQARLDALLLDEIGQRRRDPALAERTDVLSILLQADDPMTDAELRDQLITLLLAGHETTATSLAWAFDLLLHHPAALTRAREDDPAYLDAVVKETMRLRPVIFDVVRQLKAPVELGGYRLPAGINVLPAIGLVQRDPTLYSQPNAFRPERFLDADAPSYGWIPFGGGRRRCLGAAFATFEMKTVLRTILDRVHLEPTRTELERERMHHITVVPAKGTRVRLA